MSDFLNKKVIVKQIKSESKLTDRQASTLVGLGLRGVGTSSTLLCDSSVLGMIKKVSHLVLVKISVN